MIKYENLNDILVIPYRSFKERIRLTRQYERKAKKIEILGNILCVTLKEHAGLYEL